MADIANHRGGQFNTYMDGIAVAGFPVMTADTGRATLDGEADAISCKGFDVEFIQGRPDVPKPECRKTLPATFAGVEFPDGEPGEEFCDEHGNLMTEPAKTAPKAFKRRFRR